MPLLGWQELLILLVIVLIIFGAGKLSGLGEALGRSVRDFRAASREPIEEENARRSPSSEAAPATRGTLSGDTADIK